MPKPSKRLCHLKSYFSMLLPNKSLVGDRVNQMAIVRLLFLILLITVGVAIAAADNRVALVIGNAAYQNRPLANPINDALSMEHTLGDLGFDVMRYTDLGRVAMHRAIREFGERLKNADIGLFYYAGHGVQVAGGNYLLPTGEDIQEADEVPFQTIDAAQVLAKMESAGNPVNIVVLDACRNNPLVGSSRSGARGLTRMDAPTGSLVLYATAPGKTADDGDSGNGVFTRYLVKHLKRPGLTLHDVVLNTRVDVMAATGNRQVPWESSSLIRRVVLRPGSETEAETPARPEASEVASVGQSGGSNGITTQDGEIVFWQSIQNSRECSDYEAYLSSYPGGRFDNLARVRQQRYCTDSRKQKAAAVEPPGDTDLDAQMANCTALSNPKGSTDCLISVLSRNPDPAQADILKELIKFRGNRSE